MANKITINELFLAQAGNCFYCFLPMSYTPGSYRTSFTKDHFKPKSKRNGINNNLVLAHATCNEVKGNRDPTQAEWIRFKQLYKKARARREVLKQMTD